MKININPIAALALAAAIKIVQANEVREALEAGGDLLSYDDALDLEADALKLARRAIVGLRESAEAARDHNGLARLIASDPTFNTGITSAGAEQLVKAVLAAEGVFE